MLHHAGKYGWEMWECLGCLSIVSWQRPIVQSLEISLVGHAASMATHINVFELSWDGFALCEDVVERVGDKSQADEMRVVVLSARHSSSRNGNRTATLGDAGGR